MQYMKLDLLGRSIDKIGSKNELIQCFNSCIAIAQSIIPVDRHGHTYIGLGATAGMRLLKYIIYFGKFLFLDNP